MSDHTANDDEWASALAAAVHDQRGCLSNIIVSLSLLKRKEAVANDPKLIEIVRRVENGAEGIVAIAGQLQLLAETAAGHDFSGPGPSTIGTLLNKSQRLMERSGAPFPKLIGGSDDTVLEVPPEAGSAMLAALFDAADELSETPVNARITTADNRTSFVMEIRRPKVNIRDTEALFDGSWGTIGKPQRRGAALGLLVSRRAARRCGGDLVAESVGEGVKLTLTVPHSDREPAKEMGWG